MNSPQRLRNRLWWILDNLPRSTVRASILATMLRTVPDCMLPAMARHVRRERDAQARFLKVTQ